MPLIQKDLQRSFGAFIKTHPHASLQGLGQRTEPRSFCENCFILLALIINIKIQIACQHKHGAVNKRLNQLRISHLIIYYYAC